MAVDLLDINYPVYTLKFENLPWGLKAYISFRPLTLRERKRLQGLVTNLGYSHIFEKEIFDRCVLEKSYPDINDIPEEYLNEIIPEDYTQDQVESISIEEVLPAGIITSVVNAIMVLSYPKELDDWKIGLDVGRNIIHNNIENKLKAFVCQTMPYKPDELDELPFSKFMELVAMAELIATERPQLPLDIQAPGEKPRRVSSIGKDAEVLGNIAGVSEADEELAARQFKDPRAVFLEKRAKKQSDMNREMNDLIDGKR